jgi:hypothetical protein
LTYCIICTHFLAHFLDICFVPIEVETLGAPGDEALAFFCDFGQCIAAAAAEPRSFQFLMQRVSVAVQRGNAASIFDTVP